jgi:DNA repair protein RadC
MSGNGAWLALAVGAAAATMASVGSQGRGWGSRTDVVAVRPLTDLLDRLHALERLYRSLHWQASGPTSYGDHLLYERLYKALPDEVDRLGERIVGLSGRPDEVSAAALEGRSAKLLLKWTDQIPTGLARARFAEKELLEAIDRLIETSRGRGEEDSGTENLLQSIADTHQQHVYLLGRRAAPGGSKGRVGGGSKGKSSGSRCGCGCNGAPGGCGEKGSKCGCGKGSKGSKCSSCGSLAREPADPATMTAGEINRELDRIVEARDQIGDELIAAGRGYEKSSETWAKTDPLALRFQAIGTRAGELHAEIERRYGPRAPVRLPLKGFGPRKKKGSAAGEPFVRRADLKCGVCGASEIETSPTQYACRSCGVTGRLPSAGPRAFGSDPDVPVSASRKDHGRASLTPNSQLPTPRSGSQVRHKKSSWSGVVEEQVSLLGGEPSLVNDDALVAVLLDQTTGTYDPGRVARDVVRSSGGDLYRLTSPDFAAEVDGLSRSGRARLLASGEIVRRGMHRAQMVKLQPIRTPSEVVRYVEAAAIGPYEVLLAVFLNRRGIPLGLRILTKGSDAFTIVDPRQVLRSAIAAEAVAMILVHNHPSGDPTPSSQDRDITRRVAAAARIIGIPLKDHVVVAAGGKFVSLAEQGELPSWDESPTWTGA